MFVSADVAVTLLEFFNRLLLFWLKLRKRRAGFIGNLNGIFGCVRL